MLADAPGYLAFALMVGALLTPSVVRLRVLLIAAGLAFVGYGFAIWAIPIILTGAALVVISAWRLRPEIGPRAASDIAAIPMEPQHPFLQDFLRGNLADIQRSQPEFNLDDPTPEFIRLITRNGLPAGVFLAEPLGDELDIRLDYVTPRYRDSRSGRWLLGEGKATFTDAGFTRLVATPRTYEHQTYLESLGFMPEGNRLVKEL